MKSFLKRRLKNREKTTGSWLAMPHEASAEIMSHAGFEWLVIDMEHAPIGVSEAARLIRVIDLAGVPSLCRLPCNDPVLAKNVLDAGANGIIVPTVESKEEAVRTVQSAYYPPLGTRGVGLGRAHAYGSGFEEYKNNQMDMLVVIAMIETRTGIDNAEEIARTPGIDGLLVGPYDISASLGRIGQLNHPEIRSALKSVLRAAEKAGIGCGLHIVHPDPGSIDIAIQDGYTFLALGVDMIFLDVAAKNTVKMARKKYLNKPD